MISVTGRPSHITVGDLAILTSLSINIGSAWMVENTDTQNRSVMLGMELRERKFGLPDTTWCLVSNLGRTVDLIDQETGGLHGITVFAPNPITVLARNTLLVPNELFVPGPARDVAMENFWLNHNGASFNWIVKLLQVDPLSRALLRTVATHEFSNAFRLTL